jgi:ElaB/YqjD/DUF883 family membrane-anchored ribosome-binding protein
MDDRRLESMSDTAQRNTRRLASEAQDMIGEQVERLTGRPMDSWMRDARRYVQDHPLQAVAVTIGLGFVLGKLMARD